MADLYDTYKPLRNYLRKTNIIESLGAIRWYINYFQVKNQPTPPTDLEVHPDFYSKCITIMAPWMLAVLAREVIINGTMGGVIHDLRRWSDMANAMNKLREIDAYVGENFINQENVMHYLSKVLAHQQFGWQ